MYIHSRYFHETWTLGGIIIDRIKNHDMVLTYYVTPNHPTALPPCLTRTLHSSDHISTYIFQPYHTTQDWRDYSLNSHGFRDPFKMWLGCTIPTIVLLTSFNRLKIWPQ
ncbi:hypothetical protein CPB84DRAFT_1202766 [Gymnopilus junonius]|uniref:Uncharacterized protein n=1 Tax=Gymnopilus junonius TaxID=109634 RepID=A0A9P5NLL4_GYMJU|nr:hypothetical protein CPB84DRAFT_1202766 [Gymnopilus junonius]